MKKIFALLCMTLFAVYSATAQQTLYVCSKSGSLAAYTVSRVSFDNDIFTFTYGDVTEVTEEMCSISFKVAFKSEEYKFRDRAEVGVCFSDVNGTPTIADRKMRHIDFLNVNDRTYTFSLYDLDSGTTNYYRAYVQLDDVVYYGDVQSVTTSGKTPAKVYKIINGHEFVDLGLPSGIQFVP